MQYVECADEFGSAKCDAYRLAFDGGPRFILSSS